MKYLFIFYLSLFAAPTIPMAEISPKEKSGNPDSYINKIKHNNLREIERVIAEYFSTQTEYFLEIKDQKIFKGQDPNLASLYVIKGKKRIPCDGDTKLRETVRLMLLIGAL